MPPGGHQDLLLAPGDPDEALVVDLGRGRRCRSQPRGVGDGLDLAVVPVAAHDVRAAQQQLAVLVDAHGGPGQRAPHGADPVVVRGVDGERAGGLGQAVALEDRHARAAEEVDEPVAERSAAGDGEGAAAAEGLADPPVDEAVEERVPGAEHPARGCRAARLCAIATSAARSKTRPRPSAAAVWLSWVKAFSKTRGTPRTKVGRNVADVVEQPARVRGVAQPDPRLTAPTWMMRAKTCASGRNSSVAASSASNSSPSSVDGRLAARRGSCRG